MAAVSDQLPALTGTVTVLISQYFTIRRVSFSNIRLVCVPLERGNALVLGFAFRLLYRDGPAFLDRLTLDIRSDFAASKDLPPPNLVCDIRLLCVDVGQ